MLQAIDFPAPTERLLDRAEAICRQRGSRLTGLRRQVLGLVLDSAQPTGAYDVLDRLRTERRGAAPPTVYRALDFLLEQGLIHKIERLSAFIGCVHGGDGTPAPDEAEGPHHHAAQFLICTGCRRVIELEDPAVARALAAAGRAVGFAAHLSTVEIEGTCADCAARQEEEAPPGARLTPPPGGP